jgi:AraC-like DNA-binding protein
MGKKHMSLCEKHIIGEETKEWLVSLEKREILWDNGMLTVGISNASYGFNFRKTNRPRIEVLACYGGEGEVMVNGEWTKCTEGHMYISCPYETYEYRATMEKRWNLAWFSFTKKETKTLNHGLSAPVLRKVSTIPIIKNIIQGIYQESLNPADPNIMTLWTQLLNQHARRIIENRIPHDKLEQLWRQVDTNLQNKWTIDKLCKISGYSRGYLRSLSISETGKSPLRYIKSMRMHKASAMLISSNLKIEAIAHVVGYENAFAFSTAFKKVMKITPSEYRKKITQEKYHTHS